MSYIVTSEERQVFNHDKTASHQMPKRALFYLKSLGKHRIYRGYLNKPDKGMVLFTFNKEGEADTFAKDFNERSGEDFKKEELI